MKNKIAILYVGIVGLLAIGCSDNSSVGVGVLPDVDKVSVAYDASMGITAENYFPNGVNVTEKGSFLVGGSWNETFGEVKGNYCTSFKYLGAANFATGQTPVADSAEFYLMVDAKAFTGDSTSLCEFEVYQLKKFLVKGEKYMSNFAGSDYYDSTEVIGRTACRYINADMFHKESKPYATTSPYTSKDTTVYLTYDFKAIKVTLSKEYAEKLLSAVQASEGNRNDFAGLIPGIYLKTVFGNKLFFNALQVGYSYAEGYLGNASYAYLRPSGVKVYYHYKDVPSTKSESFNIIANEEVVSFGSYFYNRKFSSIEALNTDRTKLYLRGLGMVYARINLPDLRTMQQLKCEKGENIAINNAKIFVPFDKKVNNVVDYNSISSLSMYLETENGLALIPESTSTSKTIGVKYNSTLGGFEFSIDYYVQGILNSTSAKQYPIVLMPSSDILNNQFAIINGPDAEKAMKFSIIYSKY